MTKANENRLRELIHASLKRSREYIAYKSDNPQVKAMQQQHQGKINAYLAILDILDRNMWYMLTEDANGISI